MSDVISYGTGLRVSSTTAYIDNNQSLAVKRVEVDENWINQLVERKLTDLLTAPTYGSLAKPPFEDFAKRVIQRMKEQLSIDVGVMGAKGRLGFDAEQLELLQAAIEGRANQALEELEKLKEAPAPDAAALDAGAEAAMRGA
jgi:hypothetical protein